MLNDCSKNQTNILLQQILVETLNSPDKNEKEHLCQNASYEFKCSDLLLFLYSW